MWWFATLLGCPYVGPTGRDELRDVDGDGLEAIRFGGRDCDDLDPDVGDCDSDRDGFVTTAFGGDDCDDARAEVGPGQAERCNELDDDCDGLIDDRDQGVEGQTAFFRDDDGDGFGDGAPVMACEAPPGAAPLDGDCNDSFAGIHPGAPELCDEVDWNCDGSPDDGAVVQWFADADGDGYGDPAVPLSEGCDEPPDAASNASDCDDGDPLAHPLGFENPDPTERCDGIDNDCDGLLDGDDPGLDPAEGELVWPDVDGDGFGDPLAGELRCPTDAGYVGNDLDCDDSDPLGRPGAPPSFSTVEICDGFDNDCDGRIDAEDAALDPTTAFELRPDGDDDGFGDALAVPVLACALVDGFVGDGTDCDDDDGAVNPAADERCATAADDDCDGLANTDDPGNDGPLWFRDADLDGVGIAAEARPICEAEGIPGFAPGSGDCDDGDGTITADVPWYADGDGDGFGDPLSAPVSSCFPLPDRARLPTDCDDGNAAVRPGAAELCNEEDDDCDGAIDEDAPGSDFGFEDEDGDGYGRAGTSQGFFCVGVADNAQDCDDTDPLVQPFAPEVCDDRDNDCDLQVDLDDPNVVRNRYFRDADLDGFGDPESVFEGCDPPIGFITRGDDCDDTNPAQYFDTYVIAGGAPTPQRRPSIPAALAHPGRCVNAPLTLILEIDQTLPADLTMGRPADDSMPGMPTPAEPLPRLTVRSSQFGRRTLTFPADAGPIVRGELVLEDLDLAVAAGTGTPAVRITHHGAGVSLHDVRLTTDVSGPLVAFDPGALPDDAITVSLVDVDLSGAELAGGVLSAAGTNAVVDVTGLLAEDVTLGAPGFVLRGHDIMRGGAVLDVVDSRFAGGATDAPWFVARGTSRIAVVRTAFHDLVVGAPLFCLEGTDCSGLPTDTPTPFGEAELLLQNGHFRGIEADGPFPWLIWQPSFVEAASVGSTYEAAGDPAAPIAAIVDAGPAPFQTASWTSLRDRFVRVGGGFATNDGTVRLVESQLVEVDWPVTGGPGAEVWVRDTAFILSDAPIEADRAILFGNVHVGGSWPYPDPLPTPIDDGTPVDGIGSLFVVDAEGAVAGVPDPCPVCVDFDPRAAQPTWPLPLSLPTTPGWAVAFGASLPPERWIPYPFGLGGTPSRFGRTRSASSGALLGGVLWEQDPNEDLLPSAWIVFHAGTPECVLQVPEVVDPSADPDGDGLSNVREFRSGTWPCLADTDGDGVEDALDPDHVALEEP